MIDMKIALKYTMLFGLMVMGLFFSACQLDELSPEIQVVESGNNLDDTVIALMVQLATNDGSFDNIVDGASCLEINFPYTVEINSVEFEINSEADFELIELLFDAFDDDDDVLSLLFPITITTADHSEILIENSEDLNELSVACIEGGLDDDIECIDMQYPVTFFTFNVAREQTDSVVVSNDSELRRFLLGLGTNDVVSIDFPVRFALYDDSEITVNSLEELKMAILNAIDSCDEDDDTNYNDDDFTEESLPIILTNCAWYIEKVIQNDIQIENFDHLIFDFNNDWKVNAENLSGELFSGLWETSNSIDGSIIDLQLDDLDNFNGKWIVYQITPFKLKFTNERGDKIFLNSLCNPDIELCTTQYIIDNLSSCRWMIADGNGGFFDDLSIDFSDMNILAFSPNEEVQDQGNWSINENVLIFNNLSLALTDFNGEWLIEDCREDLLLLTRNSGQLLVLDKQCD